MSGFENWLPGYSMTGTFMLLLWAAGVATALVVVVGVLAFRDFSMRDTVDILLRTATVVVFAALGWTWIDHSALREQAAERRALDVRSSELTARAIQPGSALACLNSVGNDVVEAACAQALFASPQAIAAAVAYVDARIALLEGGLAYAKRDRSYVSELEHLRGTLEADRFGFVAHVLAGRGCTADECAAFNLLKDTSRVQVNLRERAFDAHVTIYAVNWPVNRPSSSEAVPPTAATLPPQASGPPVPSRFSFPSSASIPPVSIMSAEPTGSTAPGSSGASAEPPATERPAPPTRRQSANRPPGPAKPLPPPPRAPTPTGSSQAPSPNPQ